MAEGQLDQTWHSIFFIFLVVGFLLVVIFIFSRILVAGLFVIGIILIVIFIFSRIHGSNTVAGTEAKAEAAIEGVVVPGETKADGLVASPVVAWSARKKISTRRTLDGEYVIETIGSLDGGSFSGLMAKDRSDGVFFGGFFVFFPGSAVMEASAMDNWDRV